MNAPVITALLPQHPEEAASKAYVDAVIETSWRRRDTAGKGRMTWTQCLQR